ncbi:MAG TPA: succinate dehydrogenase assembly factor 2 [Steroidobacteraceae bacterium]|nr:succinate dehydrogenase assembly factor 2 [Steroidobacteraceae bacterium]
MAAARARELLRWRCRRGMKELDLLLERFLEQHYDQALPERQRAFERLLRLPDPLLAELLLGPQPARPHSAAIADGPGSGPVDAHLADVLALVAASMPR